MDNFIKHLISCVDLEHKDGTPVEDANKLEFIHMGISMLTRNPEFVAGLIYSCVERVSLADSRIGKENDGSSTIALALELVEPIKSRFDQFNKLSDEEKELIVSKYNSDRINASDVRYMKGEEVPSFLDETRNN